MGRRGRREGRGARRQCGAHACCGRRDRRNDPAGEAVGFYNRGKALGAAVSWVAQFEKVAKTPVTRIWQTSQIHSTLGAGECQAE